MVEKVATTDVTVFIHGPTGTGKEVISNSYTRNQIGQTNHLLQLIVLLSQKIC